MAMNINAAKKFYESGLFKNREDIIELAGGNRASHQDRVTFKNAAKHWKKNKLHLFEEAQPFVKMVTEPRKKFKGAVVPMETGEYGTCVSVR